jgi:hypothetical protein
MRSFIRPTRFPWEEGSMILKKVCLLEEAFLERMVRLAEKYNFRGQMTIGDIPNPSLEKPI